MKKIKKNFIQKNISKKYCQFFLKMIENYGEIHMKTHTQTHTYTDYCASTMNMLDFKKKREKCTQQTITLKEKLGAR